MNHIINIFCNTDTVGYIDLNLEENRGELIYDEDWKKQNFPLSPHLPFDGITNETNLKKFISNLLPEGEGLEFVSRFFQISKANYYGLIEAIGVESAGALTFTNQKIIPTSFREISKEELTQRIHERKSKNITIWDNTPRLSVAGVQDKLPIVIVDGIFGIGQGEISSTHILKFSKNKEQHIVINEHFCMELATLCGLKTAKTTILDFNNEKVLAVERFDREIIKQNDSFKVQKIHIIDGCQLLNLDVIMKYQKPYRGANQAQIGASFKKLTRGIEFCKTKALAKLEITRWGLFNLLINNYDAHAKNISFFVTKSGLEVAPFYDLVNIALYRDW
ncbi:MAG: HipA domain-containing protein [Campylobacterales bacterium]|nr:HipA domain-containing protein [Campylobacterales bacterium]